MSTEPGSDPVGDFQRWLMRRAPQHRPGRGGPGEVHDRRRQAARSRPTSGRPRPPRSRPDEPPECQWCPICRAARRYRDSGGSTANLGGQFAGVGDTLAGLTRDAFSLFDAACGHRSGPPDVPRGPGSARGQARGQARGPPDDQPRVSRSPGRTGPRAPQTTAPSSSDPESGGRPLSMRSTRMTKPPTKAATARKAASPEMVAPTAVLMSR